MDYKKLLTFFGFYEDPKPFILNKTFILVILLIDLLINGGIMNMFTSNTNIDISINKIKMIRPGKNPKSCDLSLSVDWSIEYTKNNEGIMEYLCTLSAIGELPIQFAIQGLAECEDPDEDLEKRSRELSPLILDKCMNTMINMVNATKNSVISIKNVPEMYLTCNMNSKINQ